MALSGSPLAERGPNGTPQKRTTVRISARHPLRERRSDPRLPRHPRRIGQAQLLCFFDSQPSPWQSHRSQVPALGDPAQTPTRFAGQRYFQGGSHILGDVF